MLRPPLTSLALTSLALAMPASAVCPKDGLTGPCCQVAPIPQPTLPFIPATSIASSRVVCFKDCQPTSLNPGAISLSQPVPLADCGTYAMTVSGPLAASLKLHYTRNWLQSQPGIGQVRVYRFVALGNLTLPGAWVCGFGGAEPSPFLYGYVDYVYREYTGAGCEFSSAALVLGHNCDHFIHNTQPGCTLTLNPVGGHPGETSALVAPGSNFLPSTALVPPQGATLSHGIRNLEPVCRHREAIASAVMANGIAKCPCTAGALAPGQFTPQELTLTTTCASGVSSIQICPWNLSTPAQSFFTWSIGKWTFPGPYPGIPGPQGYQAWLTEGYAIHTNPNPSCADKPVREAAWYGAFTRSKMPLAKAQRRFDVVDNYEPSFNGPIAGGLGGMQTRVMSLY